MLEEMMVVLDKNDKYVTMITWDDFLDKLLGKVKYSCMECQRATTVLHTESTKTEFLKLIRSKTKMSKNKDLEGRAIVKNFSYFGDVIEKAMQETAKDIIQMLRDGTRYCKACDDNWSKGCRCCRMTFVGLIQERYGIDDGED